MFQECVLALEVLCFVQNMFLIVGGGVDAGYETLQGLSREGCTHCCVTLTTRYVLPYIRF